MQLTRSAARTTISRRSEEVISVLVSRREPTMWGRAVVGFVLCAVGTVWILQGTKVIQASAMSGQGKWAAIGAVVQPDWRVLCGLPNITATARPRQTERGRICSHSHGS